MNFPANYLSTIREALSLFHEQAGRFIQSYHSMPLPGSQAATEQSTYPRPQSIVTVCSLGNQLIEHGGEHLTAFIKVITEPVEVIACWTCVRSMLEACAISAWLFDPSLDAHTRVGRVFALRYEGLEQQLKFRRSSGRRPAEIAAAEARINAVEQDALTLGFARVLDNTQKKRIGIGQRMPRATEIIKSVLDEEANYRLLSAVAHGHSWAIIQLGFKQSATIKVGEVPSISFEKTDDVKGFALLGLLSMRSLARPIWNQCEYFGWDTRRLADLLEKVADKLGAAPNPRFWRD